MPHRNPLGPVVALDIDGTLGVYHDHFLWFAGLYTGKEDLDVDWDPKFKGEFNRALHMSKHVYRDIKLAYRQGGMKRCMPVFENARELTVNLRKAGAQVWICTTRPYLRLDNIDPDTRHFLKRQGLQFDGVLYGEKKYADLKSIVGKDRIVGVLDDLPEQIKAANRLGLPSVLRSGAHNAWWQHGDMPEDQEFAPGLWQAEEILMDKLAKWKANR